MALYFAIPPSSGFAIETWIPGAGYASARTFSPDTAGKWVDFSRCSAPPEACSEPRWPSRSTISRQTRMSGSTNSRLLWIGQTVRTGAAARERTRLRKDLSHSRICGGEHRLTAGGIPTSHDSGPDARPNLSHGTRRKARSARIPFTNRPVNAIDGLQCFTGLNSRVRSFNPVTGLQDSSTDFSNYYCRSFFGWPSRLVYAEAGDLEAGFTRLTSYSPFPSGLDPDSSESRYTSVITSDRSSAPKAVTEVTIVTKEATAHVRRDFDFPAVRLSDFLSDGAILLRLNQGTFGGRR